MSEAFQSCVLTLCLVFGGCGARTQLLETTVEPDAATGGSGGATTPKAPPCLKLEQHGATLLAEHLDQHREMNPALARLENGKSAALTFMRRPSGSSDKPPLFRKLGFSPWPTWPSALGPTLATGMMTPDAAYCVADSATDTFVLLVQNWFDPTPPFGASAPSLDWYTAVAVDSEQNGAVGNTAGRLPLFVSPRPDGSMLVGAAFDDGRVQATLFASDPLSPPQYILLGCAQPGAVADAVPYEDGWLVATVTSGESLPTTCANAPLGGNVHVVRVSKQGKATWLTTLFAGDAVRVALAANGLFAVISHTGDLVAYRVNGTTGAKQLFGPLYKVGGGQAGGVHPGFDVAALGDRWVVTFVTDWSAAQLNIDIVNDPGPTYVQLLPPSNFAFGGPTGVIAAPSNDSVVVTWGENTADGARVGLARFDCVDHD